MSRLTIARALPIKERRLVGPSCFLDRCGPLTWLHAGEVVHDDSLGSESLLRPGGVNVMTSGAGIAHAEQTPRDTNGRLDGVQLWTALPDQRRHMPAGFASITQVPTIERSSGIVQIFAGALEGRASPAPTVSPLLGADVQVHPRHALMLPLNPEFEHAILAMSGDCALDGDD